MSLYTPVQATLYTRNLYTCTRIAHTRHHLWAPLLGDGDGLRLPFRLNTESEARRCAHSKCEHRVLGSLGSPLGSAQMKKSRPAGKNVPVMHTTKLSLACGRRSLR